MKDRAILQANIHQLIARLHLAVHAYQEALPEEVHSIPRGCSPCGYPLTLWDDYDWLSLEIATIASTFDQLIAMEKTND